MKIVSENSEEDLETRRKESEMRFARSKVKAALIDLTANLLRIVRSPDTGGKPYQVLRETVTLMEAFKEYDKVAGHWPPAHEIAEALSTRPVHESIDEAIKHWDPVKHAEDTIISGALQIAASRLLGQRTIAIKGSSEMHDGIRELEQAYMERLKKEEAERQERLAKGISDSDHLKEILDSIKTRKKPKPSVKIKKLKS
jgi:hypothetical protein